MGELIRLADHRGIRISTGGSELTVQCTSIEINAYTWGQGASILLHLLHSGVQVHPAVLNISIKLVPIPPEEKMVPQLKVLQGRNKPIWWRRWLSLISGRFDG